MHAVLVQMLVLPWKASQYMPNLNYLAVSFVYGLLTAESHPALSPLQPFGAFARVFHLQE